MKLCVYGEIRADLLTKREIMLTNNRNYQII